MDPTSIPTSKLQSKLSNLIDGALIPLPRLFLYSLFLFNDSTKSRIRFDDSIYILSILISLVLQKGRREESGPFSLY